MQAAADISSSFGYANKLSFGRFACRPPSVPMWLVAVDAEIKQITQIQKKESDPMEKQSGICKSNDLRHSRTRKKKARSPKTTLRSPSNQKSLSPSCLLVSRLEDTSSSAPTLEPVTTRRKHSQSPSKPRTKYLMHNRAKSMSPDLCRRDASAQVYRPEQPQEDIWLRKVRALRDSQVSLILNQLRYLEILNRTIDGTTL